MGGKTKVREDLIHGIRQIFDGIQQGPVEVKNNARVFQLFFHF